MQDTDLENLAKPKPWSMRPSEIIGSVGCRLVPEQTASRIQTRERTCSKSHHKFVAKLGLEPRP